MQIYIHIPFCEQKCSYCRFASVGKIQNLHIAKYVDFLCKEIALTPNPSPLEERGVIIETIYCGGGTPGVLLLKQLEKIFIALRSKFIFADNIEITLESTPDKITKQNLVGWSKLGINRLSMGVQTLNQKSLEVIGRGNKGDIENALDIIGDRSLKRPVSYNVSLDFIIGLPYVQKGEIKKNIEYILKKYNFVKHISVYMLEDYYSSDRIIETKYDNIVYPEDWGKLGILEEEYLGEYSEIKQYLESQGFERYEISNYAKVKSPSGKGGVPKGGGGFECKHNQGYWNHSEIIGFGLGAYGFENNIRYANSETFSDYYSGKRILKTKLNSQDLFLETVMFQLRTSGLKKEIYKKLNQEKIQYFINKKYLEKKSVIGTENFSSLQLTDKGVLVMDYILKEIV